MNKSIKIVETERTQKLISLSLQGDKNAFSTLATEYQTLVFRLCFRLLCNEEDAKDMTQNVLVKVWLNLKKYNAEFMFSTWLCKITANLCIDFIRQQKELKIENLPQTVENIQLISTENIEKKLINKELSDLIKLLTKKLTPKQKLIFTLKDLEGFETEEVEKITGLSAGKIKSNLYLARQEIKKLIKNYE